MGEIKNGDFVIFYVKDNKLYPVALSSSEHYLIQNFIPGILDAPIRVLDTPQGEVVNLMPDKKEVKNNE